MLPLVPLFARVCSQMLCGAISNFRVQHRSTLIVHVAGGLLAMEPEVVAGLFQSNPAATDSEPA